MKLLLALMLFARMALAMPASSFESLVSQVDDASFSSDKIDTIRSAAQTNTFTAAQAARLLEQISMSSDQMDALPSGGGGAALPAACRPSASTRTWSRRCRRWTATCSA